jgi:hypothetical protein
MQKISFLFLILLSFSVCAQSDTTNANSPITLQRGYPVKLILMDTVSSKTAQVGDKINFQTAEDVVINGRTIITKGVPGLGTVTQTQESRILGQKGTLEFSIDELILPDGKLIQLTADQKAAGQAKTGAAIAASVIVTPLFLLKKGKDIVYYKGKVFVAYINDNYTF